MNKFYKNNIFLIIVNILTLFAIFIFIISRLQYAVAINDDMTDIISENFYIPHSRFVTALVSQLFIKFLPLLFNIHLQNFAFISEGVVKAAAFTLLIFIIGGLYFKFSAQDAVSKFKAPIYILCFFTIFSILSKIDFIWCFDTSEWFHGYITPLIFFFLLWNKMYDYYVLNKSFSNKDLFILSLLIFCNATGNEVVNISFIIFLLFLLIDNFLIKIKTKSIFKDKVLNISFFVAMISALSVLLSFGTKSLWNLYNLNINTAFSVNYLINFISIFVNKIFIENWMLWTAFVIMNYIILKTGYNKRTDTITIKYVLYSVFSFLIFLFLTLLLPDNCYCAKGENKFWLLHPGILSTFELFMFIILIFLSGYIAYTIKNKRINIINWIILLVFSVTSIILYPGSLICMHSFKSTKGILYMDDKISLHYFKKGQTAVIFKEQPFYILPDVDPKILSSAPPEFYKNTYYKERARYLVYLEDTYGVDVSPGITFADYNDALGKFLMGGGKFTDEELDKLDFSYIKNSLNENSMRDNI